MKKLVFLLTTVIVTAFGSSVLAQGTGVAPSLGSTHTYTINGGTPTSGNTYTWTVDKGTLGTTASTEVVIDDTDPVNVDITWTSDAVPGTSYYVRVVETVTATSCSNEKILVVVPTNPFYLEISSTQTTVCYPSPVTVTAPVDVPTYNHGSVDFIYTVSANNIGSGTSYQFDITELLSDDTNFSSSLAVTNGTLTGSTVTSSGTGSVTLTYTVTNDVAFTNATDPDGDAADINLNIAISSELTNQNVPGNGSGSKNVTINVERPNTTIISTDN